MLVDAQYTPYKLKHSIWDEKKGDFIDRVKDVLEDYAPGFKQRVEAQIIITPDDFEKQLGLPEGCIHHGQMALDQLFFMRPVPQYSRYRSPIRGLYLCGAGTHPGGGVTGLPGYNAAIMAARDLSSGYV
jgi:phytoene dehydrogenase-like protein